MKNIIDISETVSEVFLKNLNSIGESAGINLRYRFSSQVGNSPLYPHDKEIPPDLCKQLPLLETAGFFSPELKNLVGLMVMYQTLNLTQSLYEDLENQVITFFPGDYIADGVIALPLYGYIVPEGDKWFLQTETSFEVSDND